MTYSADDLTRHQRANDSADSAPRDSPRPASTRPPRSAIPRRPAPCWPRMRRWPTGTAARTAGRRCCTWPTRGWTATGRPAEPPRTGTAAAATWRRHHRHLHLPAPRRRRRYRPRTGGPARQHRDRRPARRRRRSADSATRPAASDTSAPQPRTCRLHRTRASHRDLPTHIHTAAGQPAATSGGPAVSRASLHAELANGSDHAARIQLEDLDAGTAQPG
jgi:hypothetical protein